MPSKPIDAFLPHADAPAMLRMLADALERSGESPFWAEKVPALLGALLPVLVDLRSQSLLFDPEGCPVERLDGALLLRWCDLVCLKTLYFTLDASNRAGALKRTRHDTETARRYNPIALETLGAYLQGYTIDLGNERLDFPIAHYNLHNGLTSVLKTLLRQTTE